MRTPGFHFDQMMRHFPEGRLLYEAIRGAHQSFSNRELANGRCAQFLSELDEETVRTTNYLMLLYDRFGQNSYVLGPKVQDLFCRTDLGKVTPDSVVEPQVGFYVALPECRWRIWGGQRTRWHRLSGVYVGFTKSTSRATLERSRSLEEVALERTMHIVMWGAANERSACRTDDALMWYSMNLDAWGRDGSDLESFFERQPIMLNAEEDIREWKGIDPLDLTRDGPPAPEEEDVEEHRRTLTAVMRVVLNLCLYLSTDDPDLKIQDSSEKAERLRKAISRKKSGGKRKKLERQLENLPRTRVVYVGPLFEALEQRPSTAGDGGGGTHASPLEHAVRPHWQRYWVGSGDQRRQRWTLKGMYVRGSGQPDRTITKFRE